MLPSDLDQLTPTQRLIVEQAFVMARELETAADSAPEGQVIDRCESFLEAIREATPLSVVDT